ncbi:Class II aldolase/adducin domain-containing protein [Mycena venus]|uniref:Class II aldolase/adducin domain-containing protein n=1 Tax=Mycena venus TaxID=2733690 RepID=A0A8H6YKY3_9AGAR|nr:Class II aldolase/adducin domain-containing protein [Mycena venus]
MAAPHENVIDVTRDVGPAFSGTPPRPLVFATKLEEREFLKFRLAQAFRIFGNKSLSEGPAGHITVRDPVRTDCFWVNPFGLHFKLIQPKDLLLVDSNGTILEESGPSRLLNNAAFMIMSNIHKARPDVLCAAHSHTPHGKAFSALGRKLDPITQDASAFYDDHIVFSHYKGMVLEQDEGAAIAAALGSKKAAILQNHGLLVACGSVEAMLHFFIAFESACRVQILADTMAAAHGTETLKINHDEAKKTGGVGGIAGCWLAERDHGV